MSRNGQAFGFIPPADADHASKRDDGSETLLGLDRQTALTPEEESSRRPRLGKFQIVRLLGAGAFGVVYVAIDEQLGREVALKLPRTTVLTDPDLKARFLREAEALGRLDHPNIVPVFEAGECDDTCYLAVGYCEGPTLAEWLRERASPTPPQTAAQIALALANAVAHAHDRQILHRDLKPSNILLDAQATHDGLEFTPRLTDFGLAKIAEQPTQNTLSGMVLGTPNYMAPEQAAGLVERIGPATDVYSLGAVLYELLTCRPPISGKTTIDTLRRVLIDEPVPVRRLNHTVPEDLEAIVAKCLDKSPARRYPAAVELADDLGRFLAGETTRARPLGVVERSTRWIRRHRMKSAMAALVLLIACLAAGLCAYDQRLRDAQARAAEVTAKSSQLERQVATSARYVADMSYVADIHAADQAVVAGDLSQAAAILRRRTPGPGKPDLRGLAWHYLWARTIRQTESEADVGTEVYFLRISADAHHLAAACKDGTVRFFDPWSLTEKRTLNTGQGEVNGIDFDDEVRHLATAGDDGTVKIWRLNDETPQYTIRVMPSHAYGALFYSGSTSLFAYGVEEHARLWEIAKAKEIAGLGGHARAIEAMAMSPDRRLLATASSDETATLWDAETLQPLRKVQHFGRVSSVAFSPDSRLVATGSLDRRLLVWDTRPDGWIAEGYHLDPVQCVAFSADGRHVIAGDRGGAIRNWRVPPPESSSALTLDSLGDAWQAHQGRVWSLAVLPAADKFISSGEDGRICLWGRGQPTRRTIATQDQESYESAATTRSGSLLFAARSSGVAAYDASTAKKLFDLPGSASNYSCLTLLEDIDCIAAGTRNGQFIVWNWKTRQQTLQRDFGPDRHIFQLAYASKTNRLAVLSGNDCWLLDAKTGEDRGAVFAEACNDVAFSPEGDRLAIDTLDSIVLVDVASCRRLRQFPAHSSTVEGLDWSPDGNLIASASNDRTVRLWRPNGTLVATLSGHRHAVTGVAFTPDGRSLITCDAGGRAQVTHVATQQELLVIPGLAPLTRLVTPFPDSRRIVFIDEAGAILIVGRPSAVATSSADPTANID
ncbi:MAG TPA: serine/threonine-protein kinase [Pirellulaceae bacterium]|nr:serine/threonine-protein kinase [Pirellulaceae bacterium]